MGFDRVRVGVLAVLVVVAAWLAGCGDESADPAGPTVTLRITRDYGNELISEERVPLREARTVMGALRYRHAVESELGGRSLISIDGLRQRWGQGEDEQQQRVWILTVNGLETEEKPATYRLHPGDLVQWDLRPWVVRIDSRAMVGAYREMLTGGVHGEPFRVTLHCRPQPSHACRQVRRTLDEIGASPGKPRPAGGSEPDAAAPQPRARVLVGAWRRWRHLAWPKLLAAPTDYGGLYARFADDGARLQLLDWRGQIQRTESAGTGLLALMSGNPYYAVLFVGGTDARGAAHAARALRSRQLRGAFAAAVTADGVDKLPLPPRALVKRAR